MPWRRSISRCLQLNRAAGRSSSRRPVRPDKLGGTCSRLRRPILPSPPVGEPRLLLGNQVVPVLLLQLERDWSRSAVGGRLFSSQAWVDVPSGSIVEVPLAQTGEGIAECELLKWFVQEGDELEEFQRLCEVQSDKATIEITSRYKGKVHQILFGPGEIVKVGETLLKILVEEDDTCNISPEMLDSRIHSVVSDIAEHPKSISDENKINGVLSTPAVRGLAKQYGVDLNHICGSGKGGRVLKEDILNYLSNKGICVESLPQADHDGSTLVKEETSFMAASDVGPYKDKTVPLRGYHRAMVKSMTAAAKVPHFHYVEEIKCDSLLKLKAAFQEGNTDTDVKHTYLPFLIKSLSMALDRHPLLNSSFIEDSNEVTLKGSHNIGIAMATPFGLVVPNIKKVQSLSILEITKELSRLQQLATNNKLSSEDVSGGTITFSNIGAVGGKFGCPLLNLPEVAIIALGRIQKLPRYADDGTIYSASIANVAVGADHRVVDGATVARFCSEWKLLIEKPELLFLHMK